MRGGKKQKTLNSQIVQRNWAPGPSPLAHIPPQRDARPFVPKRSTTVFMSWVKLTNGWNVFDASRRMFLIRESDNSALGGPYMHTTFARRGRDFPRLAQNHETKSGHDPQKMLSSVRSCTRHINHWCMGWTTRLFVGDWFNYISPEGHAQGRASYLDEDNRSQTMSASVCT